MMSQKMAIVLDVPSLRRNSDTLCIMCANVCVCMCVCMHVRVLEGGGGGGGNGWLGTCPFS